MSGGVFELEELPDLQLRNDVGDEYSVDVATTRTLGKGRQATVYLVSYMGQILALKCPKTEGCVDESLPREQDMLLTLNHIHIIKALAVRCRQGGFLMEWMPGGSLHRLISEAKNPLPERQVADISRSVLLALAYLHSQRLVHCDIKPGNVLLSDESGKGTVKLSDFGSCQIDGDTLNVAKTLAYCSPHVVNSGKFSHASDLWALGCTVIEMLCRTVWPEKSKPEIELQIRNGQHPPIPETASPALQAFLLRCFDHNSNTPPTAAELLESEFFSDRQATEAATTAASHAATTTSERETATPWGFDNAPFSQFGLATFPLTCPLGTQCVGSGVALSCQ
jgi:serine/threonine protein kinase